MKALQRAICKMNEGNDGNVENQGGHKGNQGRNVENQGGNASNEGGNVRNAGLRGIRVGMGQMGLETQGIRKGMQESEWFLVRIFAFIASARIPESEESISPSSFYGQLPDY